MKKIFSIFILSLLCVMAVSAADSHRIRIRTLPEGAVTFYVRYDGDVDDRGWTCYRYCSDTLAVVEDVAEPGQKIRISLSSTTGYVLKRWTENGAPLVNGKVDFYNNLDYVMPDEDVELVAVYDYDPGAPTFQPGAGSWDPETGTLICDNGQNTNPAGFNYNEDNEKVVTFVLGDTENFYKLYSGRYPNLATLDLSRTCVETMYVEGERPALTEMLLPATFREFRREDIAGVHLQTLTCFAMTPPKLEGRWEWTDGGSVFVEQRVFIDCPDMVVRVPREAVPLYQATAGWSDFTILPIDGKYVNLDVKLMATPDEATLKRYNGMTLRLTNLSTGQVRRLLVSGRNEYEFRYLPQNTNYSLSLQNSRGNEAAQVPHIFMAEESSQLTLPELKSPHTVSVAYTADGKPIDEAEGTTMWYNARGEYMARGASLDEVFDGQRLLCVTTLGDALASVYQQPDTLHVIVGEPYDRSIALQLLQKKNVAFVALDSLSGRGIEGTVVQVQQLLPGGNAGATAMFQTARDGSVSGEVVAAPSLVTMTSPVHGSKSMYADLGTADAVRMSFLPANGTRVQVSHTFRPAADEGTTAQVESMYAEGRSLKYEFTVTLPDGRDSIITNYLTNYPVFTFYTQLPEGTKLRVAASSPTGSVEPVEVETVIDNGESSMVNGQSSMVNVTLPIVERGYVEVAYRKSDSRKPALLVFDAQTGALVKRQSFDGRLSTRIESLPEGDYTIVAMSQGEQYQTISSHAQVEMFEAGADYVEDIVSVQSGYGTKVEFSTIPITTTQLNTNLAERRGTFGKRVVTVGSYSGLNVKVKFKDLEERTWWNRNEVNKDLYPTNCKLEIYIPEGYRLPTPYRTYRSYVCHDGRAYGGVYYNNETMTLAEMERSERNFYPQSSDIYMTSATYRWDEVERKMTIDWPNIDQGGKMQLAMMPTQPGSFRPEMYLSYTLNGEQHREIIEAEQLMVENASISAPKSVLTPTSAVSGTAVYEPPVNHVNKSWGFMLAENQYVTIMDGDQPIGKAAVQANGEWKTKVTLVNPTQRSKHNIWAKIEYRNGITAQTDVCETTYNPDAVIPLSTKMSFFNHHPVHLENVEILFDYVNDRCTPSTYGYSNQEGYNTDFTFEVNLSNNDTTKVYACALFIYTEGPDAEERVEMAHYNARKDRWIAYSKFNTRTMPYAVNVQPFYYEDIKGSRAEQDKAFDFYSFMQQGDPELDALLARAKPLVAAQRAAYDRGETIDISELRALQAQINELLGVGNATVDASTIDDDEATAQYNALMEQYPDLEKFDEQLKEVFSKNINELGQVAEGISFDNAEGLTAESLKDAGYQSYNLDDGSSVYYLVKDDGTEIVVDLARNLKITISPEAASSVRSIITTQGVGDYVQKAASTLWDVVSAIMTVLDNMSASFGAMEKGLEGTIATCNSIIQAEQAANPGALFPTLREVFYSCRLDVAETSLKGVKLTLKGLNYIAKASFYLGLINFCKDALTFAPKIYKAETLYSYMNNYFSDHPECNDEGLRERARGLARDTELKVGGILTAGATSLVMSKLSLAAATTGAAAPPALAVFGTTVAATLASLYGSEVLMQEFEWEYNFLESRYSQITKLCDQKKRCEETGDCPTCKQKGTCPDWPKDKNKPRPRTNPTLDPSGYVYEGLQSNRLEGVTTTVFYKKAEKDIFGDDVENVYVWDAENYDQVNPQVTDENGEYGWMVPAGMWQVKYEKAGYQTEYSEWLPVPPPQLDVNQAMMQYSDPQVSSVAATPKAVFINFDKFMQSDSLNTSTIFISQGGKSVAGTIEVLNPDSTSAHLTDGVRFVPTTQLPAGQTLTLTVSRNVTSYAGVHMEQDFTQDFDIVACVESLVSDSALHVIYDQTFPLTIQALPAAVAAGKKVSVKVLSDMIASADATELTLDDAGQATLNITGEAHGTTAVVLSMQDNSNVQTVTVLDVKDETDFTCPTPTTDYQPGQAYEEGIRISLICELPEAAIYYTLDGTCPCNSTTTKLYTEPITLEDGSMTLKAYAVAPGYMDSEIAEFMFYTTGIVTLPETPRAIREGTYNILGQRIPDTQRLGKGIYIINGKKVVVR